MKSPLMFKPERGRELIDQYLAMIVLIVIFIDPIDIMKIEYA